MDILTNRKFLCTTIFQLSSTIYCVIMLMWSHPRATALRNVRREIWRQTKSWWCQWLPPKDRYKQIYTTCLNNSRPVASVGSSVCDLTLGCDVTCACSFGNVLETWFSYIFFNIENGSLNLSITRLEPTTISREVDISKQKKTTLNIIAYNNKNVNYFFCVLIT
jgi:hypothetical protein